MPQWLVAAAATGAAAGALGASTATFVFGSAILTGAVIYGGLALAAYLLAPKPRQIGTADRNLQTTIRSAVSPARWVLGRARISGVLAYILEPSDQDGDIHLVLVLCEGNIEGIERVYVNGEEIEWEAEVRGEKITRATDGVVPDGVTISPAEGAMVANKPVRTHLSITPYYNGFPDDNPLTQVPGSRWSNAHKAVGKCCVHIKMRQPDYESAEGRIWTSLPNFEFLIKGTKISHPATSRPEWTDNAAAIRYWWLTERRLVPASSIDDKNYREAHSYCGAPVDNGLTSRYNNLKGYMSKSPRYTINGVVQSGDDHEQVEAEMDFCWAGNVIESGGMHFFRPGRDDNLGRAIPRIGEEDIISRQSMQPAPALTDRINAATMRLAQSTAADWQQASVDEFRDDEGIARDGEKLSKDLGTRTFVCCPSSAGRLLAIMVRRARAQKRFTITISPGADLGWTKTIPTDLVIYNDPDLGIRNMRCIVLATTINEDFSVTMSLERLLEDTHADTEVLPSLYQNTNLAPRGRPLPPRGITLTSTAQVSRAGTAQLLLNARWEPSVHTTIINVAGPAGFAQELIVSSSEVSIVVPWPGDYRVDFYSRNRTGQLSTSVTRSVSVDASKLPNVVNITSITDNGNGTITINYDTGNSVTIGTGKGIRNIVRNEDTGDVVVTYSDGTTDNFSIKDGAAGGVAEWIYRATTTSSPPARPSTDSTERMTPDFVPSGWSDDPPASGTYIWVSTRRRGLATSPFGEFSVPAPFRGPRGFRGSRGAQGERGEAAPRQWVRIYSGTQNFTTSDTTITLTQDFVSSAIGFDLLYLHGTGFALDTSPSSSGIFWEGAVNVGQLVRRSRLTPARKTYLTIYQVSFPPANAIWNVRVKYVSATQIALNYESQGYTGNLTGQLFSVYGVLPGT